MKDYLGIDPMQSYPTRTSSTRWAYLLNSAIHHAAAILLFGTNAAFRQLLPRPVVDCQRFALARDKADAGERWNDRLVLDENSHPHLAVPCRLVPKVRGKCRSELIPHLCSEMIRPPDYRAFRESMVNLLIHQDYSDHSRKASICHYTDQTVFWNPGDAFADADLLEPGEKEVRNPRIVTAFRRIGLSENAGWGLRDVFRNWQELGHVLPHISNDRGRKCFELILKKEEFLSEQQILFQANLGVQLTDEQARVFAFVCREKDNHAFADQDRNGSWRTRGHRGACQRLGQRSAFKTHRSRQTVCLG